MTQSINAQLRRGLIAVKLFSLMIVLLIGIDAVQRDNHVQAATATRGYLTSADELAQIRQQFLEGQEPVVSLVNDFLNDADAPEEWRYGVAGREYVDSSNTCISFGYDNSERFIQQQDGAQSAYEKMIAYHIVYDVMYAVTARDKLMDLTQTYGFGGDVYSGANQCILELAFAVPVWIQTANLLENTGLWSAADKSVFQAWLAEEAYPKVAWASRVRRNNWGSAGSVAASMIGDYLLGSPYTLTEVAPESRQLTPYQAVQEHNQQQLHRMNTLWQGDSRCSIWGIQPYGGIPDELRRGSTGCEGQWLESTDSSHMYTITQIEHLATHAEYMRRRGDPTLFNHINGDGSGSLMNAILFIIDNPVNDAESKAWTTSKLGVLTLTNRVYQHPTIATELGNTVNVRPGAMVSYGQLTHALPLSDSSTQPAPTSTPLPTNTTVPPTSTPLPTNTTVPPTSTPLPTNTTVPPTSTPLPTNTTVPPTSTPLPTNTTVPPTSTPLPTNTIAPPTQAPQLYIASLTGTTSKDRSEWQAIATITVQQTGGIPVGNVTVSAQWDVDGRTVTCVTQADGRCTLTSPAAHMSHPQMSLTVMGLAQTGAAYPARMSSAASVPSIVIQKTD